MTPARQFAAAAASRLVERNSVYEAFFAREAPRLASACREMARRFLEGGRLLALGRGVYATDAQHVSVEFIHPVIVGKRALPAMDVSALFGTSIESVVRREDIVMGFGPPGGDDGVSRALEAAGATGAMTFALPGRQGDYSVECFSANPFHHQEMMEILYHTLWETVHVYLEHRELESEAGNAAFLYPFLGSEPSGQPDVTAEAAASIRMKAAEDARLRERVAAEQADRIALAVQAIRERTARGGKLVLFGNGGSATDANDWALDCACPPPGLRPIAAVSLSAEPAVITALANDVGPDVIFLRQMIAHGRPGDLAVAISTSGGSRNIVLALEEARKREMTTMALLGYDGGEVVRRSLADIPIVVPSDYIPRIQEVQASIYHVMRELAA